MLSKVSSTLGLSSASIAASDIEFSRSSSSRSGSPSGGSSGISSPSASPRAAPAGCGLNGVAPGGAEGGATVCGGCGAKAAGPAATAPAVAAAAGSPAAPTGRSHLLGVGAGIGRFEVDDVAQEDLALVELVAPDDDRLEGERAFAQAGDHRLAAGLDALGDRDLALAGEQFHRAHLAQIHPHRIVGALGRLLRLGFRRRLGRDLDELAGLGLLLLGLLAGLAFLVGLGFLGLDHVDAHLAHHRQNVLDLLGGHLLRRHDRIELLVGHIAALLGLLDHLLDGGVGQIEQRQRGIGGLGRLLLRRLAFLLRRGLHLGRDRLDAHTLCCHVRLHRRLSHQLNSSAGTSGEQRGTFAAPPPAPCDCLPTLWLLPRSARTPGQKPDQTAKTGSAARHHPIRGSVLTEPVKLRLTLSTAPATSILPPAKRPAPVPAFRAIGRLERPGRPARMGAEALDQSLGSIERRKPRLDVAQPGVVRLGGLLAERQLRLFQFPS